MKETRYLNLPAEKISWIETIKAKSPMINFFGIALEELSPGYARVRLPFRLEFAQGFGVVQGGIITALGDAAAGIAFMTLLNPGEAVVTIELKINFLNPAKQTDMVSEARIAHQGAMISLSEFEIRTPDQTLVAKGTTTVTAKSLRE
jgi:uncharacterized protein (TIGR00369 family)